MNKLIALSGVALLLLTGCGGGGSQDTPRAAVESFVKAIVDGDYETACNLSADGDGPLKKGAPAWDECMTGVTVFGSAKGEWEALQKGELTIEDDEDGKSADAEFEFEFPAGNSRTSDADLEKIDGKWWVRNFGG